MYRLLGAISLDNREATPPTIDTHSASIGMPRSVVRRSAFGACPSAAMECSMRVQENRPEFPAESRAAMMTKFITSPIPEIPAMSKTVTKGDSSRPASS